MCICVLEGRGYVLKVCVWFKEVCMCIEGVCVCIKRVLIKYSRCACVLKVCVV